MNAKRNRREFLADVGRGMLVASVGYSLATELGLTTALAEEPPLVYGTLESLVCLMQDTPADKLLPLLKEKLQSGTELRQLVAAGALANARTFGGEDYIGFHTLMALAPSLEMSQELPQQAQPLPVFKVLYRNTKRIQEKGGRGAEVLHPVECSTIAPDQISAEALRNAVRGQKVGEAEKILAGLASKSAQEAFDALLLTVQDNTEVHRTVLPYRAWVLLDVVGQAHAHTMLRQSVRYCVKAEAYGRSATWDEPRTLLPKLLDEHKLLDRSLGTREADDAWIERVSGEIFKATAPQAAEIAAAALAEGMAPAAIGECISLAANQLVLRDLGRAPRDESAGKPPGSVHGDSIGVHACDSANAWRNMARVSNARNTFSCLILGAYQVALDRTARGGNFLEWQPLPVAWHLNEVKDTTSPETLLAQAKEAIEGNLQGRASAIIHRYGQLGHSPRPVFDLLLRYAISEDGALHAEKYYRTVSEEFAATRAAFRWRQLTALARVTASEFGRPAAGMAQARELLGT